MHVLVYLKEEGEGERGGESCNHSTGRKKNKNKYKTFFKLEVSLFKDMNIKNFFRDTGTIIDIRSKQF